MAKPITKPTKKQPNSAGHTEKPSTLTRRTAPKSAMPVKPVRPTRSRDDDDEDEDEVVAPAVSPEKAKRDGQRRLEARWTPELMEPGWTAIPNTILEHQHQLGLDALDLAILLHLVRHWWTVDNPPHPGKTKIGLRLGIDPRSVQRRIAKMQAKGLVHREKRHGKNGRRTTNFYHLDGLITEARPYAEKTMEARRAAHAEVKKLARKGLKPKKGGEA